MVSSSKFFIAVGPISAGTNTIMLVPSSMPEAGWPPIGMYGFKELPKAEPSAEQAKQE